MRLGFAVLVYSTVCAAVTLQDVLEDLQDILSSVNRIKYEVGTFQSNAISDIPKLLQIQAHVTDLSEQVLDATDDILCHENFTSAEAIQISGAVLNLTTPVEQSLQYISCKKPQFDKAILKVGSVSFLIKENVQTLQWGVQGLSAALLLRMPDIYGSIITKIGGELDAAFNNTLAVYRDTPLIAHH